MVVEHYLQHLMLHGEIRQKKKFRPKETKQLEVQVFWAIDDKPLTSIVRPFWEDSLTKPPPFGKKSPFSANGYLVGGWTNPSLGGLVHMIVTGE